MTERDTIYALSSGALPAGVAVIRISGQLAGDIGAQMLDGSFSPRKAHLRKILHPGTGEMIDEALVIWFPAPNSFTGEDVLEIQCHGGRAVVTSILSALECFPDVRPAEAGEFTRRAFDAGRLDLTEVEGLSDLIAAETEVQRRQALRQLGGGLSELYEGWRRELLRARSLIEAELDFADEDDVPASVSQSVWANVRSLADLIEDHLSRSKIAERLRRGIQIVLAGPPNAGKSSLMNALSKRDVAIVTEEAGTTRDVLEVHLDLDGLPVTLVDTAGIREAEGLVEREGIRRARERMRQADVVLWLMPANEGAPAQPDELLSGMEMPPVWMILSKADLGLGEMAKAAVGSIAVSTKTPRGLDQLIWDLGKFASARLALSEEPLATRERHRLHLQDCLTALERSLDSDSKPLELRAEDLRAAAEALGRISGRIDVEDLLDVIFGEFCIGK
ncbi:tRNA uridine-5-carboxymethylaminomethyl(34) synthesis GTPase MnmE [Rhizobiales bacterium]|uniref:tRNA uridine-5-carboxymethylaminomethyl(34) synthesis GTPase MnmE n=1 Tax=Hongsoonwoonella zoysiae TaxID=2821844 RepID=UPI0015605096|nr:tRNA uridine-5-carboxymethylaminomethyl(34) synthesis GTPase MnmE [Hongsoonwoonella zoysiae]NRG16826.1 tRNA uridine-5-carboxymethylaminomethyl(34) synthesis GTPase MnmE [Hongsoonwoonella zoysiae]